MHHPLRKDLNAAKGNLDKHLFQKPVFGRSKEEENHFKNTAQALTTEIDKIEQKIKEEENNPIYHNAFEWRFEFPEVLDDNGEFVGFDVVIGNPPWSSKEKLISYPGLNTKFKVKQKNVNVFAVFFYMGISILKKKGLINLLVPEVILRNETYFDLRKLILSKKKIVSICNWGQFPDVASNTVSIHFANFFQENSSFTFKNSIYKKKHFLLQDSLLESSTMVFSEKISSRKNMLIRKIKTSITLEKIAKIKRGIELGQNTRLVKCPKCSKHSEISTKYYSKRENNKCKHCHQELNLKNGFSISSNYANNDYNMMVLSGKMIGKYVRTNYKWIKSNLSDIDYKLGIFSKQNLLIKRISNIPEATIINEDCVAFNAIYSVYDSKINIKTLCGIINSKLIAFYYSYLYTLGSTLTTQITIEGLKSLPIPIFESHYHHKFENLVNKILTLKKENSKADTSKLESEIDQLVYQLYGLTEEEIAIVEAHGKEKSTKGRGENMEKQESTPEKVGERA